MTTVSRRAVLGAGAAALAGCGRRKGSGYDGFVFVANQEGSNVAIVDLLTFTVARRIPLSGKPSAVAAHPERRAAYVLVPSEGVVHELTAGTPGVRRTCRLGAPASFMRMAPAGDMLWVLLRGPHALAGVALDTFRVTARMRLPLAAGDFDLSLDGMAAFSFPGHREIGIAALDAQALQSTLPAPGDPHPIRFRQDGKQVIAGIRAAPSLGMWDVKNRSRLVDLPLPMEPARFCFNDDGGQLFVSGPGRDAVAIVYPYWTEVAETVLAGRSPECMAASGTPPYLFVANPQSATVTVLDISTRRLVSVVGVGADPGEILFTPDGQYALVLNRGSGDLAVMRINSLRTGADGISRNDPRRKNPPPLFALLPVGSRPVSAAVVPA
jgi:YVTN family beta-propeller protein